MAGSRRVLAPFSTNDGRLMYKESRETVRPIIRSDYWDDVQAMALQLETDFPKHCKPMTMRDAQQVDYYFDPYDIQTQSWTFLFCVLREIVTHNFLNSVAEVEGYARQVRESRPKIYDQLTPEDTVADVFNGIERRSMSFDLLAGALVRLKQWKFNWAIYQQPIPLQLTKVQPNVELIAESTGKSVAEQDPNLGPKLGTEAIAKADAEPNSKLVVDPVAKQVAEPAVATEAKSSSPGSTSSNLHSPHSTHKDINEIQLNFPLFATTLQVHQRQHHDIQQRPPPYYDKEQEHSIPAQDASQAFHVTEAQMPMYHNTGGTPFIPRPESTSGQMTSQANQASLSIDQRRSGQANRNSEYPVRAKPDSGMNAWPGRTTHAMNLIHDPSRSLNSQGQYPRAHTPHHPRGGVSNPPKLTTDDIRQLEAIRQRDLELNAHHFHSRPDEAIWTPTLPPSLQRPILRNSDASSRPSSGRTSFVDPGSISPFGPPHGWDNVHDFSTMQTRGGGSSQAYPSPQFQQGSQSSSSQFERHQYPAIFGDPLQPRIATNPFPSNIVELPQGKVIGGIKSAGPVSNVATDWQSYGQKGRGSFERAGSRSQEHMGPRPQERSMPASYRDRGPEFYGNNTATRTSTTYPYPTPVASQVLPDQRFEMDPHAFQRGTANNQMQHSLPKPHFDQVTSRPSGRAEDVIQQQLKQRRQSHGQTRHQPAADQCLYIRGLPYYFDKFAVLNMLQSIPGIVEVSDPKPTKAYAVAEMGDENSYVFVTFENSQLADMALRELPNAIFPELNGKFLEVNKKRSFSMHQGLPLPRNTYTEGNMPKNVPAVAFTPAALGQKSVSREDLHKQGQPPSSFLDQHATIQSNMAVSGRVSERSEENLHYPTVTPRALREEFPGFTTHFDEYAPLGSYSPTENFATGKNLKSRQRKEQSTSKSEADTLMDTPSTVCSGSPLRYTKKHKTKDKYHAVQDLQRLRQEQPPQQLTETVSRRPEESSSTSVTEDMQSSHPTEVEQKNHRNDASKKPYGRVKVARSQIQIREPAVAMELDIFDSGLSKTNVIPKQSPENISTLQITPLVSTYSSNFFTDLTNLPSQTKESSTALAEGRLKLSKPDHSATTVNCVPGQSQPGQVSFSMELTEPTKERMEVSASAPLSTNLHSNIASQTSSDLSKNDHKENDEKENVSLSSIHHWSLWTEPTTQYQNSTSQQVDVNEKVDLVKAVSGSADFGAMSRRSARTFKSNGSSRSSSNQTRKTLPLRSSMTESTVQALPITAPGSVKPSASANTNPLKISALSHSINEEMQSINTIQSTSLSQIPVNNTDEVAMSSPMTVSNSSEITLTGTTSLPRSSVPSTFLPIKCANSVNDPSAPLHDEMPTQVGKSLVECSSTGVGPAHLRSKLETSSFQSEPQTQAVSSLGKLNRETLHTSETIKGVQQKNNNTAVKSEASAPKDKQSNMATKGVNAGGKSSTKSGEALVSAKTHLAGAENHLEEEAISAAKPSDETTAHMRTHFGAPKALKPSEELPKSTLPASIVTPGPITTRKKKQKKPKQATQAVEKNDVQEGLYLLPKIEGFGMDADKGGANPTSLAAQTEAVTVEKQAEKVDVKTQIQLDSPATSQEESASAFFTPPSSPIKDSRPIPNTLSTAEPLATRSNVTNAKSASGSKPKGKGNKKKRCKKPSVKLAGDAPGQMTPPTRTQAEDIVGRNFRTEKYLPAPETPYDVHFPAERQDPSERQSDQSKNDLDTYYPDREDVENLYFEKTSDASLYLWHAERKGNPSVSATSRQHDNLGDRQENLGVSVNVEGRNIGQTEDPLRLYHLARLHEELADWERAEALDYELHRVIREQVSAILSRGAPFDDRFIAEDVTSQRMLKVRLRRIRRAGLLHKLSPIADVPRPDLSHVIKHNDMVLSYLRWLPRMTDDDFKRLLRWEAKHPDMEENLEEASFNHVQVVEYGLCWRYRPEQVQLAELRAGGSMDTAKAKEQDEYNKRALKRTAEFEALQKLEKSFKMLGSGLTTRNANLVDVFGGQEAMRERSEEVQKKLRRITAELINQDSTSETQEIEIPVLERKTGRRIKATVLRPQKGALRKPSKPLSPQDAVIAKIKQLENEVQQNKHSKNLNRADLNALVEPSSTMEAAPQKLDDRLDEQIAKRNMHDSMAKTDQRASDRQALVATGPVESTFKLPHPSLDIDLLANSSSSARRALRRRRSSINDTQSRFTPPASTFDFTSPVIPNLDTSSPLAAKGKGFEGDLEGRMFDFKSEGNPSRTFQHPRKLSFSASIHGAIDDKSLYPTEETSAKLCELSLPKANKKDETPSAAKDTVRLPNDVNNTGSEMTGSDQNLSDLAQAEGKSTEDEAKHDKTKGEDGHETETAQIERQTSCKADTTVGMPDDNEFPPLKENTQATPQRQPKVSYASAAGFGSDEANQRVLSGQKNRKLRFLNPNIANTNVKSNHNETSLRSGHNAHKRETATSNVPLGVPRGTGTRDKPLDSRTGIEPNSGEAKDAGSMVKYERQDNGHLICKGPSKIGDSLAKPQPKKQTSLSEETKESSTGQQPSLDAVDHPVQQEKEHNSQRVPPRT